MLPVGASAQVVFTDITDGSGVALTDALIESVAWGDFDNDGDLDLLVPADAGEPTGPLKKKCKECHIKEKAAE